MDNFQQVYDEWTEKARDLHDQIDRVDGRYCHCDEVERRYLKKQLRLKLAGIDASYRMKLKEIEEATKKEIEDLLNPPKEKLSFREIKTIIEGLGG